MNAGNFIYDSPAIDFNIDQDLQQNMPRPSVLLESRKDKYRNYYKSKWANLKLFLQDKSSLEASIDLLKTKTVEQFSSKCREIYQKKIEIQLMTEKNRRLIQQGVKSTEFSNSGGQYEVTDGISGLPTDAIQTFLFMFRENNELMLKLIENIDSKKIEILVPFLCHFFYENFYTENMEQNEIIYLVYLLLEKEIDKLIIQSEKEFLDDSFLAKFLKEMGCRYEIKNYIDIILNDLICFLEESNLSYYSLDLKNEILNNLVIPEKSNSGKSNIKQSTIEPTLTLNEKKIKQKDLLTMSVGNFGIKNNNNSLINNLPNNAHFICSQKFLTEQYFKEKNEDVKQFLFKHLKKVRFEKNPFLYDCSRIKDYIKRKGRISKESIISYTNGYNMITKFIEDFLKELENDTIVPYSIRLICLFIKVLIPKKFKSISNFEINNFIAKFLFDKLLFPVLINPERCDIGKDRLISLQTRKNLFNIYLIMKNLVKGELFNAEKNPNLVIFNKFIIDNYHKVSDIIKKMIDVKMPKKLENLSKEFYSGKEIIRTEDSINYNYFEENPNDFMQHKSICFTINELNMIYDIVDANKDKFLIPGSKFEETFDTLSNFISMIKNNPNHYYVIISDDYKQETKELLFHKDTTKPLGKGKTKEEIIENIHYCIKFLINNLEILPHWEWVCENYKTLDTFKFINQYLNSYEGVYNFYPGSVPLNWYSLYIINNLESIKPEDALNDYQALYDEIEKQILQQHKKLSKLNEFLTVNMTSKFILIDNKIKTYQDELKNVKSTYINVKTLQLMYSKEIISYLTMYGELSNSGIQLDDMTGLNNLIYRNEPVIVDKSGKKKYEIPKEKLCTNINQFISKLMHYYQYFFEELKSIELMDSTPKKNIPMTPESIKNNHETKMKEIIDSYLKNLYEIFISEGLFQEKTVVSCDNNNENNIEKNDNGNAIEEEKILSPEEIAIKSIKNYILKTLCLNILSNDKNLLNEDIKFKQRCTELQNITIEDLKIPEELYDKSIFEKIIYHVKRMDYLRTPEDMFKEFQLAVQLINSLFIFMLDKKVTDNDDFTSMILYVIIKALPTRMYFNFKLIIYFFDEKDKKGMDGYYITQSKSSLNFIMNDLNIDSLRKSKKIKNNKNIDKDVETAAPTAF